MLAGIDEPAARVDHGAINAEREIDAWDRLSARVCEKRCSSLIELQRGPEADRGMPRSRSISIRGPAHRHGQQQPKVENIGPPPETQCSRTTGESGQIEADEAIKRRINLAR